MKLDFNSKIIKDGLGKVRSFKDNRDSEEAKKEVDFLSRELKIEKDLVWDLASCKVVNLKLGDWFVEVNHRDKKYKQNYTDYGEMFSALDIICSKIKYKDYEKEK